MWSVSFSLLDGLVLDGPVMSDNGSKFLPAAQEDLFSSPSHIHALARTGVNWKFIPKKAPWFGGFWERLIGQTKLALKKVLGRAFTSLTSIQTLIVEIEGILNNQLLTTVPTDINDPDTAHLLYSRKIVRVPYHVTPQNITNDPNFGDTNTQ